MPKAAAKISNDLDVLLAFSDFPAEHWIHLHTTNPMESTFATVRLRQRVTKGPGSRAAGVAMAFKLIESAQTQWRWINAPHLVPLSVPVPISSTAASSNDPPIKINKKVVSKQPETLRATGIDDSSIGTIPPAEHETTTTVTNPAPATVGASLLSLH